MSTNLSAKGRRTLFWVVTAFIPAVILFIPCTEVFSAQMKLFFAITACAVLIFAFELLDNMLSALLLPVAYLLSGIAPIQTIFSPWASTIPWFLIGVLILINICERTDLLKRFAYFCIIRSGSTYNGILYGLLVCGIILNIIMPGSAMLPLVALAYGICRALDLGVSKAAAGIMIAAAVAANTPVLFTIFPTLTGMLMGIASANFDLNLSFTKYLIDNCIAIPWCFFLVFLVSKIFKPEKNIACKSFFSNQLQALGPIKSSEKKTTVALAGLFIYILTMPIHKMDMAWGFLIVACLLCLPCLKVGTKADYTQLNLSMIIFITGCMSIGQVSNAVGAGKLIADLVFPLLNGASATMTLVIIWLLGISVNFLLTPVAAIATLTVPLTEIAFRLELNPFVIYYTFLQGLDQLALPYENVAFLFMMSFGLVSTKDFCKFFTLKMVLSGIFLLCCAIPYWKLIGLF